MTESDGQLAAVEQLLAECGAVRGWLDRLDRAPPAASDLVRERVRRDYQQRLDQLTAGLTAHVDVVVAKLADHRRERDELTARAAGARDGLAEAELRHTVGEYDDARFQGERLRFTSDMESFEVGLAAVSERIARLEEVQAAVERGPQAPASEAELPVAAPVVEVHEVPIGDLAPEHDDVLAVFDEPSVPAEAPEPQPPTTPDSGPLSFRPSGVSGEWPRPVSPPARPRPFETAPPLGIPAADVPPRFIRPGERLSGPPAPPANVPPPVEVTSFAPRAAVPDEPPPPPIAAEPIGGVPVGRTLRCGECGAMNRPLEWYCEKCGAELTAV